MIDDVFLKFHFFAAIKKYTITRGPIHFILYRDEIYSLQILLSRT